MSLSTVSAPAAATATATSAAAIPLFTHIDNSWIRELRPDDEWRAHWPNRRSRPVKNGHYVPVLPTPLPQPKLLSVTLDLARDMGISESEMNSDAFLRYFSGDMSILPGMNAATLATQPPQTIPAWATGYALAIMGSPMVQQDPFGTGDGYGDGRVATIGEIVNPDTGKRYELQLKGAGTTPYARTGDGRAVLRSSIREFLASEAMFHLNVSSTRAITLTMSQTEQVARPWYSRRPDHDSDDGVNININDPRLSHIPMSHRAAVIEQLRDVLIERVREPDRMEHSPAAITCRVASSFIRIGHIDLMARRYKRDQNEKRKTELELIIKHTLYREFAHLDDPSLPLSDRILILIRASSEGITNMITDWIRVGFVQGNFNSDNCLVAGRTMDFGPFGFIEKFDPYWNMWTGGGRHYSFLMQPDAAFQNFKTLARACMTLLDGTHTTQAQAIINTFPQQMEIKLNQMWMNKMGFGKDVQWDQGPSDLMSSLQSLMQQNEVDYTILWRQLAYLPQKLATWIQEQHQSTQQSTPVDAVRSLLTDLDDVILVSHIDAAFYAPKTVPTCTPITSTTPSTNTPTEAKICTVNPDPSGWAKWIRQWLQLLTDTACHDQSITSTSQLPSLLTAISHSMCLISPKYIPREWMLVTAYEAAHKGDFTEFQRLQTLFMYPYEEQSEEMERTYYRKATRAHMSRGGTAFMT